MDLLMLILLKVSVTLQINVDLLFQRPLTLFLLKVLNIIIALWNFQADRFHHLNLIRMAVHEYQGATVSLDHAFGIRSGRSKLKTRLIPTPTTIPNSIPSNTESRNVIRAVSTSNSVGKIRDISKSVQAIQAFQKIWESIFASSIFNKINKYQLLGRNVLITQFHTYWKLSTLVILPRLKTHLPSEYRQTIRLKSSKQRSDEETC